MEEELLYAASRPSTYPIPTIKEVENEAIHNSHKVIKEEEIEAILNFTLRVEGDMLDEPHPKKMKVQLRGDTSKNEVTCSTLKELLSEHNIIVDMGQLDEIPSVHSPFHRLQTDLFMYHKQFFKQKIVTGVVATSHADNSQDESDESDVEGLPKNTYVYTVGRGLRDEKLQEGSQSAYS